ncbi:glycosyltransferase [Nocardioides sp. dk4132]|uniref:glycosyltransferase n=1 Tax=unclassified Nocardioides TaxID=2615069 RepID=UPI0012974711|nr:MULTISPECIES: glycosyltransferase [unclassified Nocardioides]MQW74790.1 glycosyltransferase [Nocardioides sp. dk4132]QGA06683.1 glycosyltransferase [Nocardioides sp. dk884]
MSAVSVVIAAHDEEAVIGHTLDTLLAGAAPDELEVVVAANGCRDRTVQVAEQRPGVTVVEVARASKTHALNVADRLATGFPRVYLDADIAVPVTAVRALCAALEGPGAPLVAVPGRHLETRGRPWPVRGYTAIHRRLPAFEEGLFGRGMVAVSETGRARFSTFPDVVADDLFLDSLFGAEERVLVREVTTTVETPWRTADLRRRLARVRRGNAALRAGGGAGAAGTVRGADRWSWLRDVVLPRPWLAPAGLAYAALTAQAALEARRQRDAAAPSWGHDESTRTLRAG